MKVTPASKDELLDFVNKVRRAGGGELLSELMPAEPQDNKSCVIAKNVNFGCKVDQIFPTEDKSVWGMEFDTSEQAQEIAEALGLEVCDNIVRLPENIGQIAQDFDDLMDLLHSSVYEDESTGEYVWDTDEDELRRLAYLYPLIEDKSAYEEAPFIDNEANVILI